MKKINPKLSIALALVLIASMMSAVFGGCGTKENVIDTNGNTNAAITDESAVDSEQTTKEASEEASQTDDEKTSATADSTASTDSEWKKAYKDYILGLDEISFLETTLIHLDDNDIPELYIIGSSEADGETVVTYADGKIAEYKLLRIEGVKYTERSGHLVSFNGNMGYYPAEHIVLENGKFTVVDTGLKEEKEYIQETDTLIYTYYINEKEVSEKVFNDTMDSWLPDGNRTTPQDSELYYKYDILEVLK